MPARGSSSSIGASEPLAVEMAVTPLLSHYLYKYRVAKRLRTRGMMTAAKTEVFSALHQAKAGLLVVGQHMAGHGTAIGKMQPDRFRLGDEITDGEYHALADENSVSGPLGA